MKNTAFFVFLIILILGIVYVLKTSDNPPATGMTQTPKEYIEFVEQKKAAKRAAEALEKLPRETAGQTDPANP
ncbi:MAG: aldehyde dehydrogenase [Pseudomonadota bacterium]